MKVEMRQDLHLWVTFDEPYKEIIVDRERGDVRIRIGNSVIKIRYKENELRDILLNDVPLQMSRYK